MPGTVANGYPKYLGPTVAPNIWNLRLPQIPRTYGNSELPRTWVLISCQARLPTVTPNISDLRIPQISQTYGCPKYLGPTVAPNIWDLRLPQISRTYGCPKYLGPTVAPDISDLRIPQISQTYGCPKYLGPTFTLDLSVTPDISNISDLRLPQVFQTYHDVMWCVPLNEIGYGKNQILIEIPGIQGFYIFIYIIIILDTQNLFI